MTKPFNLIQDLERSINNVKYQLKYSKDRKAAETIVNDLTKVKTEFNAFLNGVFYADVLETLILELIITKIKLESKLGETHIYDLEMYLGQLAQIIKEGKDLKSSELIHVLKQPYERMIEIDFEEKQDFERVERMVAKIPKNEHYLETMQEFVEIIKTEITLNQKQNEF